MAHGITPILDISDKLGRWPLTIDEIMVSAGVQQEDLYSYTTRYTLEPEQVEMVKSSLFDSAAAGDLSEEEAAGFWALMEANGYDVSFIVDTY